MSDRLLVRNRHGPSLSTSAQRADRRHSLDNMPQANQDSIGADHLAANIMHFARLLRRAGLPIGSDKVLAAVDAARLVGIERRDDLRSALAATLIDRAEQRTLFEQAFAMFWRDPELEKRLMHALLPKISGRLGNRATEPSLANRLRDALAPAEASGARDPQANDIVEFDAALTFSAREVLQNKDFETMSADELEDAKRLLRTLSLPLPPIDARRYRPDRTGRKLDMRRMLRSSLRFGGECVIMPRRSRCTRQSALVILCDISGSMARYSRMLLHFAHRVSADRDQVFTFTFGTRLTNITRTLRHRDVDIAVGEVARHVKDWSGGTRIGECIRDFNRHWSRRILAQGAVVLIISDGLDCGEGPDLACEMRRLHASCRLLLWLNPLLRFAGFEPRAGGIRAMLPHVDRFMPAHNITSLRELGAALAALGARDRERLESTRSNAWK
jgi:uncharacterized protein with von Willebrand factor type A (vWA) domain